MFLPECRDPACCLAAFLERYEARECQVRCASSWVLGLLDPVGIRYLVVAASYSGVVSYCDGEVEPDHVRFRRGFPEPRPLAGFSGGGREVTLSTLFFHEHDPAKCFGMYPAVGNVDDDHIFFGRVIDVVPTEYCLTETASRMASLEESCKMAPWEPLPPWMMPPLTRRSSGA